MAAFQRVFCICKQFGVTPKALVTFPVRLLFHPSSFCGEHTYIYFGPCTTRIMLGFVDLNLSAFP